jgi:hypothetical protein
MDGKRTRSGDYTRTTGPNKHRMRCEQARKGRVDAQAASVLASGLWAEDRGRSGDRGRG